jgi:hypothetical protein
VLTNGHCGIQAPNDYLYDRHPLNISYTVHR